MSSDDFFARPFDEGTLTKLRIFQLYTREWLPVFFANPEPRWSELDIYDFFAGPGTDSLGVQGSPLRILDELRQVQGKPAWSKVKVSVHLFDDDSRKIGSLRSNVRTHLAGVPGVHVEIESLPFEQSFPRARSTLAKRNAAKLVLIDQFGVDCVSDDVFRELATFPTCDTLFFISSSTLHRFRGHPSIKQRIERPEAYRHLHRAVADYYRSLLPPSSRYWLGQFSIKKGSNIYGVIFGSSHPLGLDKFLNVAWQADAVNGEANFDVNRDDCGPLLSSLLKPTKIVAFENDLTQRIRAGEVVNEADVIAVCFQHGVKRQHAESVLKGLKARGEISCAFRVPDIKRLNDPRPLRITQRPPSLLD